MIAAAIPRDALRRILAALVSADVRRSRATVARADDIWSDDGVLTVDGAELDSLEIVQAAAAVSEMFDLDASELEWPRRSPTTIGEWLDEITEALSGDAPRLTVMTSGSTGKPKPCPHSIDDLLEEVAFHCSLLPSARRVVALVPAHHIYGLIWTALLPSALGIPVVDASTGAMPPLREGDLIVGVPEQWRALLRSRRSWPRRVAGVSAGAPLDDMLAADLLASGLGRLLDVYGSSETGGVAIREAPGSSYALLPRWRFLSPLDEAAPVLIDRQGRENPLPDRIVLEPQQRFSLAGRLDDAVQVGGLNVWPQKVADILRGCPGVADAVVRLAQHGRLKAFVVPAMDDHDDLDERLRVYATRLLEVEQRPTAYTFGSMLPLDTLGKASDWP